MDSRTDKNFSQLNFRVQSPTQPNSYANLQEAKSGRWQVAGRVDTCYVQEALRWNHSFDAELSVGELKKVVSIWWAGGASLETVVTRLWEEKSCRVTCYHHQPPHPHRPHFSQSQRKRQIQIQIQIQDFMHYWGWIFFRGEYFLEWILSEVNIF